MSVSIFSRLPRLPDAAVFHIALLMFALSLILGR